MSRKTKWNKETVLQNEIVKQTVSYGEPIDVSLRFPTNRKSLDSKQINKTKEIKHKFGQLCQ